MSFEKKSGSAPKYRTAEHKRRRAALVEQIKRDGSVQCTATTCVMPSREITNPNGRARDGLHLGHDDDGVEYVGAQHNACNVKDGARRGRERQSEDARRWRL